MAEDIAGTGRVTFGRGYNVWIMGIDGTWRRNCVLTAVSANDAELTLETNLKEFFLLLSSTGLAYRRCELVKVNGAQIDIRFISAKANTKKKSSSRNDSEMASA
jgi:SHS2 domain-containing protein